MLMDQLTALRLAKIMKIGWRNVDFCGRIDLSSTEATELGIATLKVSWLKDYDSAPQSILVEATRPVSILKPEFYANWVGFTQAYSVKIDWKD